jgi:hypothetical protein
VLVRGEEDAVAVLAAVGEVGEVAEGQEVGGREEREAVVPRQPFASFALCRDPR